MTVTFTRLMEAQSKRHLGVQMQARTFSSAAELVDSIMERRARMRLVQAPAVVKRAVPVPPPEPVAPKAKPSVYVVPKVVVAAKPAKRKRDVLLIQSEVIIDGPTLPWKQIIDETCFKHDVTRVEFMGASRVTRLVAARHEAMFRLSHELGWSTPRIGRLIGDRDPSTVLYGIGRHAAKIEVAAQ